MIRERVRIRAGARIRARMSVRIRVRVTPLVCPIESLSSPSTRSSLNMNIMAATGT